jgi:hypothetical protein
MHQQRRRHSEEINFLNATQQRSSIMDARTLEKEDGQWMKDVQDAQARVSRHLGKY